MTIENTPHGATVQGIEPPVINASSRLIILALALGGFAIGTTEFASMAVLPYFSQELGVDSARAADAISAYALGVVIGAPTLAVLGAKVRRRLMLTWLMVAFAVFNILSAFAPTFGSFMAMRFLSGLPHGAYFGVGALVIAAAVPKGKRAAAVSKMFLGLTIATTLGVPMANVLGQTVGWRWTFGLVGIMSLLTAISVFLTAPRVPVDPTASPLKELGALKNRQVWLTLATGAIGYGGFFAVYTYLVDTSTKSMNLPASYEPFILMLAGVGMTVFTMVYGWASDRSYTATTFFALIVGTILLIAYPWATANVVTFAAVVFLLGILSGVSMPLQIRLMDVAKESQQLAAALHHAAFNVANALGPFLAAKAIGAGYDYPVSGHVGAVLSIIGLAIFGVTILDWRRRTRLGHA
ncbi:MFS transporter [Thioclava sp. GXIMD2076]|uniref:MFS transporter n=1 Tax=Thioclava sp. GXIMD2076 TaxID=3131931 RepID=UPI0030CDD452